MEGRFFRELSELSDSVASENLDHDTLEHHQKLAEQVLSDLSPSDHNDKTKMVLETFLCYLPISGKYVLSRYIFEHQDATALTELGDHLRVAVLARMRVAGNKTPIVPQSPFGDIDSLAQEVIDSPSRKEQNRLKDICLKRDNFCCAITGNYALESRKWFPLTDNFAFDSRSIDTNASHIIPFALGKYNNCDQESEIFTIWTLLYALFPDLKDVMRPDLINEPRNVITMAQGLNRHFGKLKFALESTDEENVYDLVTYPGFPLQYIERRDHTYVNKVHFTRPVGNDIELPSRVLLDTHAALARIYHASGAAETIEKILDDHEELYQLAEDGSTNIAEFLPAFIAV